ncbi:MAG: Nif11-like leader peptide family natural product precursor [Leptolyngbyaceae bacterium]|nr:Nif11-like leader peptide family natural product precursor [Leptolyngbyaceae bacterium]
MAKEAVVQLFRAVQTDPEMKEQLNAAPNPQKFVEMAQTYGFHFTVEEWQEMTRFAVEELEGELSEIPGI